MKYIERRSFFSVSVLFAYIDLSSAKNALSNDDARCVGAIRESPEHGRILHKPNDDAQTP